MGLLGDLGKGDPAWCGMKSPKKKKKAKKATKRKKTDLQIKSRAYVEWLHEGGSDPSHHAYPAQHEFVSLCGRYSGGLNGGRSRPQKCSECRPLAKAHIAAVKQKEKAAWEKWLKDKKRQKLIDDITGELEILDWRNLRYILGHLSYLHKEDVLYTRGLCLPDLETSR
jgi:hypothetical protein